MATQGDYEACPFCGGHKQQPLLIGTKKGDTISCAFCVIECLGCYAQGPRDPDVLTAQDALRLWNKRKVADIYDSESLANQVKRATWQQLNRQPF